VPASPSSSAAAAAASTTANAAAATTVAASATANAAAATAVAASTTAATAAAAGQGTKVKLSLTLSMTLAAFNATVQQSLKEALALAAGLTRSDAARVSLAFREGRRRLLAGSVAVDVIIDMPTADAAGRAASQLTAAGINARLAEAGLPSAVITSPATSVSAGRRGPRPGGAAAAAGLAAVGMAVGAGWAAGRAMP
jgi:hypothetical protein